MNKYIAEFIGTFFLFLAVGTAAVLGTAGPLAPIAIGGTLMVMIYACAHTSGGHFNPAVTLGVFIRGRCEGKDIAPYIAAQLIGAVIAAFIVIKLFAPAVLEPGKSIERFVIDRSVAVVAAEVLFTFALVYVFLNVTTSKNTQGNNYFGLAIGFTVMAGIFAVGSITPGAFNPAISTALCLTGKLGWADSWMHFMPQFLGGVLAAFTFKGLNPDDK